MKVLVVADREEKALWDYYMPERLSGVELILSCGDLDPAYLEFLVTMTNVPLLYVRGNHDKKYNTKPPQGCICVEDRIYNYKGLRILGLGGSMRYRDAEDMYTEVEMRRRVSRVLPQIYFRNGFDILLTHAPAKGYGDLEDLPHQGFDCFNMLLEKMRPAYMLHGHVHQEYGRIQQEHSHPSGTRILNACGHLILEIGQDEYPPPGKTGSFLYDLVTRVNQGAGQGTVSDRPPTGLSRMSRILTGTCRSCCETAGKSTVQWNSRDDRRSG